MTKVYTILLFIVLQSFLKSVQSSILKPFLSSSISSTSTTTMKKQSNDEVGKPSWPNSGNPHILITGGAGYIGTHTIVCLLQSGYDVTVIDNLINSNSESLKRVFEITGVDESSNRLRFYPVDLCNQNQLRQVFETSPEFSACIHFAGLKAVGESVKQPLRYYHNNIDSTMNLLELMDQFNCRTIVFSSSATVYGSAKVPITEDTPTGTGITNPYGRTKYMIEEILKDFKKAKDIELHDSTTTSSGTTHNKPWSVIILRYFNPVGAHPSGLIGEDPNGIPNNLMPYVSQVVIGRRDKLTVFGSDYDTPDGTGVRDYIHVMDLAEGHVTALNYIQKKKKEKEKSTIEGASATAADIVEYGEGYGVYSVFNLGTGIGYSVLEMIDAMKKASHRPLPHEYGPRREGDIAVCYADPSRATEKLGWKATRSLDDMCRDLWAWSVKNPNGYHSASIAQTPSPSLLSQQSLPSASSTTSTSV